MAEKTYTFDKFTEVRGKFTAKITLSGGGTFGFTQGFLNKYNLNDSKGVKLYYDSGNKAVAFQFVQEMDNETVPLRKRGPGAHAGSKSFFGKYNLSPKLNASRYDPIEVKDEKIGRLFVIEMQAGKAQP